MPTLSSNIVKRQIASVHDVEEALARQAVYGGDLVTNLLELTHVHEAELAAVIAESLGLEAAPAGELPPAPERVRRLLPGDVAQRYGLCPLQEVDGKLVVAVSEPLPLEVVSDLEFSLGLPLVQHASTLVRVQQAVARDYGLALDRRIARVLAKLAGEPDPHPSVPVLEAAGEFESATGMAVHQPMSFEPDPVLTEGPVASPPTTQPYALDPATHIKVAVPARLAQEALPRVEAEAPTHVAEAPAQVEAEAPAQVQAEAPAEVEAEAPTHVAEAPAQVQAEASAKQDESAPAAVEAVAAPEATKVEAPPARSAPRNAHFDLFALARGERQRPREKRRRGPYTLAMAEEDLLDAETRDEVVSAFFDFSAQYFEYAALFAVHGDIAEGKNAQGAGAPRAKVQAIGVPLDLPSTLSDVAAHDAYRLTRLSASGIDAGLAKDLERRPGPLVLVLPIRVRNRTVLVFYGDHGSNDVALDAIGDVISFAPLVAAALERLILRKKERARGEPSVAARPSLPRQRRAELPTRGERASALAHVLETPWSRPPPAPPPKETAASVPPLARPVISVGPTRSSASVPVAAPRTSAPAQSPSLRPIIPFSRTPIPSSFAPNAPPHEPAPSTRKSFPDDRAGEQASEPHTQRGLGKTAVDEPEAHEPHELETTQRYRMPADEIERALAEEQQRKEARSKPPPRPHTTPPEVKAVTAPPPPVAPIGAPLVAPAGAPTNERPETTVGEAPPRADGPSVTVEAEESIEIDEPTFREDEVAGEAPDLALVSETLHEDEYEEMPAAENRRHEDSAPLAPLSRSIAHSARPLPLAGNSVELRLPAVIVDIAQDTEDLVARLASGDASAADRLVQIGAAAVPGLVGAFPGPITSELRRTSGEGPARASDCGPILKVLARIGPKAAGVLAVRSNDKDSVTRAWATRLLGEMPCLDAARAVTRRFVDDDAEVRRAALAAGRMLQAHPATGVVLASTLSEMLLDSTRQDRLQHMVIEAIADLREARAVPALATLLATGSPEIQRSAHWALVVLARTDYADNAAAWDEWWRVNSSRHRIEWLIDALMHESQEIRRAAGDELKSLTKEYFGYYDDLPARERERAQKRYRDWWDSKGKARFT